MPTATRRKSSAGDGLSRDAAARLAQKWLEDKRARTRDVKKSQPVAPSHTSAARRAESQVAYRGRDAGTFDVPPFTPSQCLQDERCAEEVGHGREYLERDLRELHNREVQVPGGVARTKMSICNRLTAHKYSDPRKSQLTAVLCKTEDGVAFGGYTYLNRDQAISDPVTESALVYPCDGKCVKGIKDEVEKYAATASDASWEVRSDWKLKEYDFGKAKIYMYELDGRRALVAVGDDKGSLIGVALDREFTLDAAEPVSHLIWELAKIYEGGAEPAIKTLYVVLKDVYQGDEHKARTALKDAVEEMKLDRELVDKALGQG